MVLGSPWTEASRGQTCCASTRDSLLAGPRHSGVSGLRESLSVGPCALACGCQGQAILLVEQAAAGAKGGWGLERPSERDSTWVTGCPMYLSQQLLVPGPVALGVQGHEGSWEKSGRVAGPEKNQQRRGGTGAQPGGASWAPGGQSWGRARASEAEPMRSPNNTQRSPLGGPWSLDGAHDPKTEDRREKQNLTKETPGRQTTQWSRSMSRGM